MKNNTKVSVIIPTYNDAPNLIKAIDSVLDQSYKNIEIIVIDDGSKDDTKNILNSYIENNKIIYLYQNNKGVSVARSEGIHISKGEYIAFLDSDDEWIDKEKIDKQIEFLDNNLDYALVGTGVVNVDEKGQEINRYFMPETDKEIRNKILRINCFVNSSVVFRKKLFENIGKLESLLEDYDLWLKLGIIGKFKNLPIYAVLYSVRFDRYGTSNKILRLRENIVLSNKYKDNYPNHFQTFLLGHIKILFYPIFVLFPLKIKGILLKLHKKL